MTQIKLNTSMCMQPAQLPPSAWTGHIPFGAWLVEELEPRVLVELGTHNGTSYLALCQAVKQCGLATRCHAVDTWQGDEHAGSYGEDVFQALRAMHDDAYGSFSQLLRMTFAQALSYFDDGSIDLLHIDGLHTYDAVREDYETWLPKLSDRGVILFHDTVVREREFGVWKLWAELQSRWPAFEFHHSHGLGVLLVGKQCPEAVATLGRLQDVGEQTTTRRLFEALADTIEQRLRLAEANAVSVGLRDTIRERDLHIQSLGAEITGFQQQVARLQAQRTTLEAQHIELEAQRAQLHAHRQELQEILETERRQFSDERAQFHAQHASLEQQREQLEAHRRALEGALELERTGFSSERAQFHAQHASLEAQRDQLEQHRQALQAALEAERAQASAALAELEAQHASLEQQRAEVHAHRVALQAALDDAHAALAHARADVHALTHERDALLASRSWRWTVPLRSLGRLARRKAGPA